MTLADGGGLNKSTQTKSGTKPRSGAEGILDEFAKISKAAAGGRPLTQLIISQ